MNPKKFAKYIELLRAHTHELTKLYNTISIYQYINDHININKTVEALTYMKNACIKNEQTMQFADMCLHFCNMFIIINCYAECMKYFRDYDLQFEFNFHLYNLRVFIDMFTLNEQMVNVLLLFKYNKNGSLRKLVEPNITKMIASYLYSGRIYLQPGYSCL